MMKAVPFYQHGPADVLKYEEDFPDPEPARGQVVIDVEYCGVNHLDIWTRMGIAGKKINLPHICGCDIVGTVKKKSTAGDFDVGERVMVYPGASCGKCTYCKKGRENLCSQFAIIGGTSDYNGGYAEAVAVPARNVIRLEKGIESKTAAVLAVSYLTAWNMLSASGAGKGKSLLVYGAGSGVGMATIQLARALGVSTIITTAGGHDKTKFGKKLGAHHVVDRSETKDIASEVISKLDKGEKGVDIVIDHVGAATWQTSIAVLKAGGRMQVCGMTSGNDAVVPVRMFYSKQITMTGALMGTKTQLLELLKFVQKKKMKVKPIIDSIFPLKEARQAQERMEKDLHTGKILLSCRC
jgi:NADPH:quinone reductase-like Zn-dependent oxidoreductase